MIVGIWWSFLAIGLLVPFLDTCLGVNGVQPQGVQDPASQIPVCRLLQKSSKLSVKHTEREEIYDVTSDLKDGVQYHNKGGRHVCELPVHDLLCHAGCGRNMSVTLYAVLLCREKSNLQIVFTNPHCMHTNLTSFLELKHCDVSLWNIGGVYGQAVHLQRLRILETTNIDDLDEDLTSQERNETDPAKTYIDTLPGLDNLLSLWFYAREEETSTIPHFLYTRKWPNINSVKLRGVNATQGEFNSLKVSMPKLEYLFIEYCNVSDLAGSMFSEKLRTLSLTGNQITNIERDSFSGLGQLQTLSLDKNQITTIDQDTFGNLSQLEKLTLSFNNLTELPIGVFRNLSTLYSLNLGNNHISNISEHVFDKLSQLRYLRLNNNDLQTIPSRTFFELCYLMKLDLSNNFIHTIADEAITYNEHHDQLRSVQLQHNQMTYFPTWIFTTHSLARVNLSDNLLSFEAFANDLGRMDVGRIKMKNQAGSSQPFKPRYTKDLYLSRNRFSALSVTNITADPSKLETLRSVLSYFKMDLENNDILCDCNTYSMSDFLRKERVKEIDNKYEAPRVLPFYFEHWTCTRPEREKDNAVVDIKMCLRDVPNCPHRCDCLATTLDGPLTVDCSQRNFTRLPAAMPNQTETIIFSHNAMVSIDDTAYLRSVRILDLSHNRIKRISPEAIASFDHMDEVYLNNNLMDHIPVQFGDFEKVKLKLTANIFVCDCHMKWSVKWIWSYRAKITDIDNVDCASGVPRSQVLYHADEDDFICEIPKETLEAIAISIGVVMSLLLILLLVVYKFQGEIKVFLYFHLKWHPFDRTNDSDIVDMLYDAFVSYNSADVKWVMNTLGSALETPETPYRLCIHDRDFRPGGTITDNILYSVKYSRRMIMVLTKNFLRSEWCRLEFKSAHRRVLKDRTNYLIVILFDGLDFEDLDEDIRFYLKTNTYIEFGNKWFWQRLQYAMPRHSLAELRGERYPDGGWGNNLFPTPYTVELMQFLRKARILARDLKGDTEYNDKVTKF